MTMHRWIRGAAAIAIALTMAAPAWAQDRLYHVGFELGAFGRFGERIGPSGGLDGRLAGGGRFAVRDSEVTDLRTGGSRALPPGTIVTAIDPARPRVFLSVPEPGGSDTATLALFDIVTGTLEPLVQHACRQRSFGDGPALAAYAYDAQLLVVQRCASPSSVADLVAVDLRRPARPQRVLPIATASAFRLELSADGSRLYVQTSTGFLAYVTEAFDVDTGARVGSAAGGTTELRWDDALDGVLLISGGAFAPSEVWLFGPSLEPRGSATFVSHQCPVRVQASPHTGRIYVTRNGTASTGAEPVVVEAYAGQPLQLVASGRPSPSVTLSCEGAVLRTAPGAPRRLTAAVAGSDVTLDWVNVGAASAFAIDVGVAPGRTDASVLIGPDSTVTFVGVPRGTYYVRVRGGNEFGGGRPSSEIRLVVP